MEWAAALACLLLAHGCLQVDAQEVGAPGVCWSAQYHFRLLFYRALHLAAQGSHGQWRATQPSVAPAPGPWGSVLLGGRVVHSQAGCLDGWGSSAVTVAVRDVPVSFSDAAVTCMFLPAGRLAELGLVGASTGVS